MARVLIAFVFGVLAVVDDLVRRRISNWIAIGALVSGLAWQIAGHGWRGGVDGLLGTLTGAAVFLIFYLLGGMGGGDIKLMAGFGALLGPSGILQAALWTAAFGGIFAMGAIGVSAVKRSLSRSQVLANAAGLSSPARTAPVSIPYAPAIALGVWLSLIPKS
jgi:prepilin peptidase CpaA